MYREVKQFQQSLQGSNFVRLRRAFGPNFVGWFDIVRRVLFVAKKLSRPHSEKVNKSYSKCFRLLTEFFWSQNNWDSRFFMQTLQQFDPEVSQLFLQIVGGVMHHPRFSAYVESSRRWFREEELQGLNRDPRSPYQQMTKYRTRCVVESFAAIVIQLREVG